MKLLRRVSQSGAGVCLTPGGSNAGMKGTGAGPAVPWVPAPAPAWLGPSLAAPLACLALGKPSPRRLFGHGCRVGPVYRALSPCKTGFIGK